MATKAEQAVERVSWGMNRNECFRGYSSINSGPNDGWIYTFPDDSVCTYQQSWDAEQGVYQIRAKAWTKQEFDAFMSQMP